MDDLSLAEEMFAADEAFARRQERTRRAFLLGTFDEFLDAEEQAREKRDGDSDRPDEPESCRNSDAVRIVDVVA